jgi:hypothetical protein
METPQNITLTETLESQHFTAQKNMAQLTNYYRWILGFYQKYMGKRIWDAGAGAGIAAQIHSKDAEFELLTDFGKKNLDYLKKKFQGDANIIVESCDFTTAEPGYYKKFKINSIIHLDVLEHIENDLRALKLFSRALENNGTLLLKVPAHPFLYCDIDRQSLHYRRYTKKGIKGKLINAGFKIEKIRYMNAPGAILYLYKGRIKRQRTNFSITIKRDDLSFINRVIPLIQRMEKIFPPFFGLSIIAIARKVDR